MSLLKRFTSLAVATSLSGGAKATSFTAKTTGTPERTDGPPGAWQQTDMDRVTEIITGALRAAESLLGLSWNGNRHVARKIKPFDEREWQIHVLSTHEGKTSGLAAAEEDCQEWDIRNLRKRHGFDSKGRRSVPCPVKACSVCPAIEELA